MNTEILPLETSADQLKKKGYKLVLVCLFKLYVRPYILHIYYKYILHIYGISQIVRSLWKYEM